MPLPECTPKSPSNSVDIEALNQWMELGLLLHVHINPHLSSHPLVIKHGLLESPPALVLCMYVCMYVYIDIHTYVNIYIHMYRCPCSSGIQLAMYLTTRKGTCKSCWKHYIYIWSIRLPNLQRTSKCGGFWFCHFMPLHATSSGVPLRVAYATSSGVCHFEWRMPLRVAYATSSGVCHFEWRMPLQVAYATSSGVCHFEWRMPLRVAYATSSGVLTV